MNTPTNNIVLRRTEHRFYAEIITAIATRNERKDTKHAQNKSHYIELGATERDI